MSPCLLSVQAGSLSDDQDSLGMVTRKFEQCEGGFQACCGRYEARWEYFTIFHCNIIFVRAVVWLYSVKAKATDRPPELFSLARLQWMVLYQYPYQFEVYLRYLMLYFGCLRIRHHNAANHGGLI